MIASIVASRLATLSELETIYSTEDAHDLLEILSVDIVNNNLSRG